MKINDKLISGWGITEFDGIKPLEADSMGFIGLNDIDKLTTRTAQWILDHYYVVDVSGLNHINSNLAVCMSGDDCYKAAIMERYPQAEAELKEHFGENWYDYYLRFGH